MLDETEEYGASQIDRSVIAPNQIRTIIQTFKERVFKDIFTDRTGQWLPKTLIFAKDDDHADRIVKIVREVFGEGNEFCKKVTYRVGKKTAEDTIAELRTNSRLRVGVTVDMIATGTDIKPLEIVMFMRDVKSPGYYEQMKGRGTRVIGNDELQMVTPDAKTKTRFVLIDCVEVTETDKTESKSLERKPSIPTDKLMLAVARGDRDIDTICTLGNRLIRLDMKLDDKQRRKIEEKAGMPLATIAARMIHATNDERLVENARKELNITDVDVIPSEDEIQKIFETIAGELIKPFHDADFRDLIEDYRREHDQIIDDSADELIKEATGYTEEKAQKCLSSWKKFIEDHKDELDAITLIYQRPYKERHLSYAQIEKLAEEIKDRLITPNR